MHPDNDQLHGGLAHLPEDERKKIMESMTAGGQYFALPQPLPSSRQPTPFPRTSAARIRTGCFASTRILSPTQTK